MSWLVYPQDPLDRRLGGTQSQSGCRGKEKNSQPPPDSCISWDIQNSDSYQNNQMLYSRAGGPLPALQVAIDSQGQGHTLHIEHTIG